MKKYIHILTVLLLIGSGCTHNFEEINKNPNSPDQLTNPGLLFTNVIRSAVNNHFNNSFTRGSIAGDLLFNDFASNYANWARADAPSYFFWNFYNYIRDLNEVIALSEERGLNNYKGVALVLRSWMFQCLTDLYGPIPFRESASAKLSGIANPGYEQQENVYAGLLADLEEANQLLGSTSENVVGDILYSSNLANWKKFSTALMLRIALRQSGKVAPAATFSKVLGNAERFPLFTGHQDQAALTYIADRLENESPLYRRSNSDYATSTRVSKNLVTYLKSMSDPRLHIFALPTEVSSAADANGVRPDPSQFEYEGAVNGNGPMSNPQRYSAPGMLWAPNQFNPTLASANAAQGILISYSEVQFILAEAAEKGFIPGGAAVAENYYLNGIKNQFAYYQSRIGDRYAGSYLKLSAADLVPTATYYEQPTVKYEGTADQKLKKIWLQKWLSHYMCGFEAWSEWRRTGFPEMVVGSVGPGYIGQRVLYPADEQRINESHYQQAVTWLGADDLKTKVWWAK